MLVSLDHNINSKTFDDNNTLIGVSRELLIAHESWADNLSRFTIARKIKIYFGVTIILLAMVRETL